MRIFKMIDEELEMLVGTLLYYEKSGDYVIELVETLDEWTAPLLFTSYVKKGIYTIPRDISFLWVKERVIPSGRQNIGSILDTHKLKRYDEIDFLELSFGKCSQDHIYVQKVHEMPYYVEQRMEKNIRDCTVLDSENILCFFEDNTTRKINLNELVFLDGVDKVLRNTMLLNSCKVGTGGYCITFNNSIDIPSFELYRRGVHIPLSLGDFTIFIKTNILDTGDTCDMLQCSRQNISYLIKQEKMTPIKCDVKGNLFLKGEVLSNTW